MMKNNKLFDQVMDDDNDGFSEDGDLDLGKIHLGNNKTEETEEIEETEETEKIEETEKTEKTEETEETEKTEILADDDGFGITDELIKDVPKDEKISYVSIANKLADIIPFEEKDDKLTEEVFINKIKSTLETSSKTLDKTKYDPTIVRIIEHVENEGSIEDFYQNDTIRQVDSFLSMKEDDQLERVITNELAQKTSKEDLDEAVELQLSEMTDGEKKSKLNLIKANLNKVKKTEFEKITESSQKFKRKKEQAKENQVIEERKVLVSAVDKLTTFMNLPVNERTRKFIKNEIANGNFDTVLDEDVANVKINSYFYKKFGEKILSNFESKMTEESKKSFRKGTEKTKEVKHNIVKKGSSVAGGKATSKGFKGLKNMLPKEEY